MPLHSDSGSVAVSSRVALLWHMPPGKAQPRTKRQQNLGVQVKRSPVPARISGKPIMKRLCLLGLIALSVAFPVLAESRLDDKPAFIEQLLRQMRSEEKIGQRSE